MAENYKFLYEQTKKQLEKYQDEIVPGLREQLQKANSTKSMLTNADRIRGMGDEELAKTLNSAVCPPHVECDDTAQECVQCWIEWLQQSAEED